MYRHLSSVQNPGWLFDIGDFTTQSYGDPYKPISISIMECHKGFERCSFNLYHKQPWKFLSLFVLCPPWQGTGNDATGLGRIIIPILGGEGVTWGVRYLEDHFRTGVYVVNWPMVIVETSPRPGASGSPSK